MLAVSAQCGCCHHSYILNMETCTYTSIELCRPFEENLNVIYTASGTLVALYRMGGFHPIMLPY